MRIEVRVTLVLLTVITSCPVMAQFGVCTRAANDAAAIVNQRTQNKVQFVLRHNYPPQVIQAHLDIIYYSQQQAFQSITQDHNACNQGYRHPQQIVDGAMFVFSMGLSTLPPPGMVRIDISEIANGRPLGGPDAVVPKIREEILRGDRGTGANIIRDPIRCLTFQRKC